MLENRILSIAVVFNSCQKKINLLKSFLKKMSIIFKLSLLALFISNSFAYSQNNFLAGVYEETLNNGMKIIVKENTSSLVSFAFLVKAGLSTEGKYTGSGISHFIEHLLFEGTEKRKEGEIAKNIEALGGEINAFTSYDYTVYTLTVPRQHFSSALEILSDAILRPKFTLKKIEKERKVILKEMTMRDDNPSSFLFKHLTSLLFYSSGYEHPVIGYPSLFKKLTLKDLENYYRITYIPSNFILAVCGGVDKYRVIKEIKKYFSLPRQYLSIPSFYTSSGQNNLRKKEIYYSSPLLRLYLGYLGPSISSSDIYALDVAAIILGGGRFSRLYQRFYLKQREVSSIEAFTWNLKYKGGFFIFATLALNKKREDLKKLLSDIREEIEKLKQSGPLPEELNIAKEKIISDYLFSHQDTLSLAIDLATSSALVGEAKYSSYYLKQIKRVTREDVIRVVKKYLTLGHLNITFGLPEDMAPLPSQKRKETSSAVEKIVLKNGLTILLKQDNTYPSVAMRIILKGGVFDEVEDNQGITYFISRLLLKGSKNYSPEEINKKIESLGARLDTFSGNNSFGVTVQVPSENLEKLLPILEDILKYPIFSKEEIEKEKPILLSEIASLKDSLFRYGYLKLKEALFLNHPYGYSYLGTRRTILRITRQEIIEFYQKHFNPKNMVIGIAGDLNKEKVLKLLKQEFSSLKPHPQKEVSFPEPEYPEEKEILIKLPKEEALVMIGSKAVSFRSSFRYPLEIIAAYLGSMSGVLYEDIREKRGKSYWLGSALVPGRDTGIFYIAVGTDSPSVDKIKEIIRMRLNLLRKKGIPEKRLQAVKNFLLGEKKRALDTNSSFVTTISFDEFYGLGYNHYKEEEKIIKNITNKEIIAAANKYLNPERLATLIIMPEVKLGGH